MLLQRPEMAVRRLVDGGRLARVGDRRTADGRRHCRINPSSVVELFPADGSERLRRLFMGAILAGRFVVPAPSSRWGAPMSLQAAAEMLRG